jgi:hypothetical protein
MRAPSVRPGGRSSRVKSVVFDAVEALVTDNPGELPSMGAIAARAGVNPTSLYRRWGEVSVLAAEVAVDRLVRDFPVPDTGSLRGDLTGWAGAEARSLSGRKNSALLRIMTATAQASPRADGAGALPIARRLEELETMLARARQRGEYVPKIWEVLEIVLAPIYLRILFLGPIKDASYVVGLVNRALSLGRNRGRGHSSASHKRDLL